MHHMNNEIYVSVIIQSEHFGKLKSLSTDQQCSISVGLLMFNLFFGFFFVHLQGILEGT